MDIYYLKRDGIKQKMTFEEIMNACILWIIHFVMMGQNEMWSPFEIRRQFALNLFMFLSFVFGGLTLN